MTLTTSRMAGAFALKTLPVLFTLVVGHLHAQVLEFSTTIDVNFPEITREYTYVIQVNNRDMDWLGNVSIPYEESDKVDILEAAILGQNGKPMRTVGKKEITTRHNVSEGAFFEDDWVHEFQLKWNQYPYQIRYRYRVKSRKFIYVGSWVPLVYWTVPTERATLTIRYPSDFRVRIYQPEDVSSDSAMVGNRVERRWTFSSVKSVQREELSLPREDLVPRIVVAPHVFNFGVEGSLDTWATYGSWQNLLNAGRNDLPVYEKQKVQAIVSSTKDKREQIRGLYHYVQDNTRYINVAMNVGGLKSYPASYVSTKKYGDCKALTTFMKSLLEEAGIPSFYANVNGADNPTEVLEQVPGPQFNHMILCVPMGKDTIWLENTSNSLPSGYLGTFTQNRRALLVTPTDSRLVMTPALTSDQVICRRTTTYDVQVDGTGLATAQWELRGDDFERYKGLLVNGKAAEVRESIEKELPSRDHVLVNWVPKQANRESPVLTFSLELEAKNLVRTLGTTRVVRPPSPPVPELENPASRKTPVRINYPLNEEQTFVYHWRDGGGLVIELPKPIQIASAFGSYTVQCHQEGSSTSVKRTLILSSGLISLEKYRDFYAFISAIRDADRTFGILLKPKP